MTPQELDSTALLNKSRKYVGLAFDAEEGDSSLFLAYAGAAIEFLGKAFLSSKSPFLVVDPASPNSMYACVGIKSVGDVKTIAAKTLNERLKSAIKAYSEDHFKFVNNLFELRNAELHGGTSPVLPYDSRFYQAKLWTVAAIILSELDMGLEDWVPQRKSSVVLALVGQRSEQLKTRVEARMAQARKRFDEMSHHIPEVLNKVGKVVNNRDLSWAPTEGDNVEVNFECPVCGCSGELVGYLYNEDFEVVFSDVEFEIPHQQVTGTCESESFACSVCEFRVGTREELDIAGLPEEFDVYYEKEFDFEPDYGNE